MKAKQSKVKKAGLRPGARQIKSGLSLCQPDLMGLSPLSNQFEPTETQPIRRQARQNGVCQ